MADLVLADTYCGLVHDTGTELMIDDARDGKRLDHHSGRKLVLAYHGFGMRDEEGECIGSLCHWDERPRFLPASEPPLLRAAADLIARLIAREAFLEATGEARVTPRPTRAGSRSR